MATAFHRAGPRGRRRRRRADPRGAAVPDPRSGCRRVPAPASKRSAVAHARLTRARFDDAGAVRDADAIRDCVAERVLVAVGIRRGRALPHRRADDSARERRGHAIAPVDAVSSPAAVAAALDRLVAARSPLLVIADFDGTLSPGTRDPGAARIEPGARRALRRLAAIAAARPEQLHVAVLTGRTVADVAERTRVGGIDYLGDHGLQHGRLPRGSRGPVTVTPEAGFEGYAPHAEALATGVTLELGSPPWLFVERKGPSVAFHVRQADDIPAARAAVLAAILAVEARAGLGDHGLEPYRGRSVVDLRPRDAGGKGEAAARLIATSGAGAAISFGDDLSDTDAFDAVIAARDDGRLEAGRIVAVHGRVSTPPEILARADLVVASAWDVGRMLAAIARRLEREGSTG